MLNAHQINISPRRHLKTDRYSQNECIKIFIFVLFIVLTPLNVIDSILATLIGTNIVTFPLKVFNYISWTLTHFGSLMISIIPVLIVLNWFRVVMPTAWWRKGTTWGILLRTCMTETSLRANFKLSYLRKSLVSVIFLCVRDFYRYVEGPLPDGS